MTGVAVVGIATGAASVPIPDHATALWHRRDLVSALPLCRPSLRNAGSASESFLLVTRSRCEDVTKIPTRKNR
jgi:hypothetical protein